MRIGHKTELANKNKLRCQGSPSFEASNFPKNHQPKLKTIRNKYLPYAAPYANPMREHANENLMYNSLTFVLQECIRSIFSTMYHHTV
jgi:hypothetical protein